MVAKKQKIKGEEDSISKLICEEIKNRKLNFLETLKIEPQKHIFIGTTVGMFKGKLRLLFQSAKQDIVIYYHSKNSDMRIYEDGFYMRYRASFTDQDFLVPIVIYEVKYKQVTTHQVRQYSEEARMIKTIFPFCQYNLLLLRVENDSTDVNKVYMSSKSFDSVVSISYNKASKIVKELEPGLRAHIEYLKKHDKFFKLNSILFI